LLAAEAGFKGVDMVKGSSQKLRVLLFELRQITPNEALDAAKDFED